MANPHPDIPQSEFEDLMLYDQDFHFESTAQSVSLGLTTSLYTLWRSKTMLTSIKNQLGESSLAGDWLSSSSTGPGAVRYNTKLVGAEDEDLETPKILDRGEQLSRYSPTSQEKDPVVSEVSHHSDLKRLARLTLDSADAYKIGLRKEPFDSVKTSASEQSSPSWCLCIACIGSCCDPTQGKRRRFKDWWDTSWS